MLTPQLQIIKKRLENLTRHGIDGTEPLFKELQQLEALLNEIEAKSAKTLNENLMVITCRATTSGPGEYCSCCGKKL